VVFDDFDGICILLIVSIYFQVITLPPGEHLGELRRRSQPRRVARQFLGRTHAALRSVTRQPTYLKGKPQEIEILMVGYGGILEI